MREIAVIGLGKFGKSVAETYAKSGGNVLAIDIDDEKVQELSDRVTCAVTADVTDVDVVKTLGLSNVDVAVVAISDNLEASVMATILSKEEGVPYVIAKAQNDVHGKVLKKVGADSIIFPEKEMGMRIAKTLKIEHLIDMVDLTEEFSIVEVKTPREWFNKTLIELNVRKNYGVSIIAIKSNEDIDVNMDPYIPIKENSNLLVIGKIALINKTFGNKL